MADSLPKQTHLDRANSDRFEAAEPLGLQAPLLPPTPLGQSFLAPQFLVPLGVRSLLQASPSDSTTDAIFQDAPFFETARLALAAPSPVQTVGTVAPLAQRQSAHSNDRPEVQQTRLDRPALPFPIATNLSATNLSATDLSATDLPATNLAQPTQPFPSIQPSEFNRFDNHQETSSATDAATHSASPLPAAAHSPDRASAYSSAVESAHSIERTVAPPKLESADTHLSASNLSATNVPTANAPTTNLSATNPSVTNLSATNVPTANAPTVDMPPIAPPSPAAIDRPSDRATHAADSTAPTAPIAPAHLQANERVSALTNLAPELTAKPLPNSPDKRGELPPTIGPTPAPPSASTVIQRQRDLTISPEPSDTTGNPDQASPAMIGQDAVVPVPSNQLSPTANAIPDAAAIAPPFPSIDAIVAQPPTAIQPKADASTMPNRDAATLEPPPATPTSQDAIAPEFTPPPPTVTSPQSPVQPPRLNEEPDGELQADLKVGQIESSQIESSQIERQMEERPDRSPPPQTATPIESSPLQQTRHVDNFLAPTLPPTVQRTPAAKFTEPSEAIEPDPVNQPSESLPAETPAIDLPFGEPPAPVQPAEAAGVATPITEPIAEPISEMVLPSIAPPSPPQAQAKPVPPLDNAQLPPSRGEVHEPIAPANLALPPIQRRALTDSSITDSSITDSSITDSPTTDSPTTDSSTTDSLSNTPFANQSVDRLDPTSDNNSSIGLDNELDNNLDTASPANFSSPLPPKLSAEVIQPESPPAIPSIENRVERNSPIVPPLQLPTEPLQPRIPEAPAPIAAPDWSSMGGKRAADAAESSTAPPIQTASESDHADSPILKAPILPIADAFDSSPPPAGLQNPIAAHPHATRPIAPLPPPEAAPDRPSTHPAPRPIQRQVRSDIALDRTSGPQPDIELPAESPAVGPSPIAQLPNSSPIHSEHQAQPEQPSDRSIEMPQVPIVLKNLGMLQPIEAHKPLIDTSRLMLTADQPVSNSPRPTQTQPPIQRSPEVATHANSRPIVPIATQPSNQRHVPPFNPPFNPHLDHRLPVPDAAPSIVAEAPESWSSVAELLGRETAPPTIPIQRLIETGQNDTGANLHPDRTFNRTLSSMALNASDRPEATDAIALGQDGSMSAAQALSATVDGAQETIAQETMQQGASEHASTNENTHLETLAREIYHLLRQRLEIERERQGHYYLGRLRW